MTEKVRKRLEEVKALLHDDISREEFDEVTNPICDVCHEEGLQDDCPLGYLMFEVLEEEITDAMKATEVLVKAKRIINNF